MTALVCNNESLKNLKTHYIIIFLQIIRVNYESITTKFLLLCTKQSKMIRMSAFHFHALMHKTIQLPGFGMNN